MTKVLSISTQPTTESIKAHIQYQNIQDLKFDPSGLAFIDDKQAQRLANVEIEKNDVLINITGDSVARVCRVPISFLPARVNQHVATGRG